jgi:uncharacterized RDD family membrane protein YckC
VSESSPDSSPVPADLPARLAARAIDVVVLAAVDGAIGMSIGFGFDWLIVGAAIVLAYFTVLDVVFGATLGKVVMGLGVIGQDGGRPTLRQALTREAFTVVGAVPFIGPLLAVAAWAWIIATIRSSPLRQGKHDSLAGGTRVVRLTSG